MTVSSHWFHARLGLPMLSARSPALYVETEGIFSSWKESECFPATPFVLMFSWLGATERLSTKHSLEPVLRWGFTQIPQFWMTAFTPSAGGTHTRLKLLVRAPVITKSSEPPLCLPAPSYSQTAYSCSLLSYTCCLFPLPVCKPFFLLLFFPHWGISGDFE